MYKRSTFNDIEKQKVKAYLKNDKGNLIFKERRYEFMFFFLKINCCVLNFFFESPGNFKAT